MGDALGYLYDIYENFINFVFNDMEFFTNVTFGWVLVSCLIFGILIRSILSIPKQVPSAWVSNTYNRGNMKWVQPIYRRR